MQHKLFLINKNLHIKRLQSLNALNVYQINLYQHLNFVHKVASLIFNICFRNLHINMPQISHIATSV